MLIFIAKFENHTLTRYQLLLGGQRQTGIESLPKASTDGCVMPGIEPGTARSLVRHLTDWAIGSHLGRILGLSASPELVVKPYNYLGRLVRKSTPNSSNSDNIQKH